MGIKGKMIDIGKKITFANCLKMKIFFAFAFEVFKKCYYDPKKFWGKKIINIGIKKRRILC
jgi:hypothetical protein